MTDDSPINWQEILAITNNDQQLADDIVSMFASELPEFVESIKTTFAKGDIKELSEITHKMHGSCCYCGATKLKECVKQLEIDAKTNITDNIPTLIDQIEHEVTKITAVLKNRV